MMRWQKIILKLSLMTLISGVACLSLLTLLPSHAQEPPPRYLTLPTDFPPLTVTIATSQTAPGAVFLTTFHKNWLEAKPYLLILDEAGEPIFARKMTDGKPVIDFKKQPSGYLSYWDAATRQHHLLDESYQLVGTHQPQNGYQGDFHEFHHLPNGETWFLINDWRPVDMSQHVSGGQPDALVAGLVVQGLDAEENVIFEWHSLDHTNPLSDPKAIEFTDSVVDLRAKYIDYIHANAIEFDAEGNVLISSRHLDEVFKINRETGQIMWRLGGGKKNEFTFINDPDGGFHRQHDVRLLGEGRLSLFDNRLSDHSRAVIYQLDEISKTATLLWEHRGPSNHYAYIMGSARYQPNGNMFIGWASVWRQAENWQGQFPLLSEVTPAGETVFELSVPVPLFTYRAFRAPWAGQPSQPPTLVSQQDGLTLTLAYSWNGATAVARYQVLGGPQPNPDSLWAVVEKSGFETRTHFTRPLTQSTYFRVLALAEDNTPLSYSNQIFISALESYYLPLVLR